MLRPQPKLLVYPPTYPQGCRGFQMPQPIAESVVRISRRIAQSLPSDWGAEFSGIARKLPGGLTSCRGLAPLPPLRDGRSSWTVIMRIWGLKFVTVKKGGKTYRHYYHRATNKRIEAAFGTAAFIQEVTILEQRARDKAPRDGSLGALVTAYRKSPQFTGLADVSRKDYDRVFDWLKPMGDIPLVSL